MNSLNIVADENIPRAAELFAPLGSVRTVTGRGLTAADVADADVLLVRSVTPVNAALLDGSRVRWVGTATIGVDHLDQDYLLTRAIGYASAPGSNAVSVVEYVLSALAGLDGVLERLLTRRARVGIVGVGNVGGRLLQRLEGMGIAAIGYDPFLTAAGHGAAALAPLAEVLDCEVVCLHTPLTRNGPWPTWHLIGERQLAQLRPGSVLLNAGRGPVVDNRALLDSVPRRGDVRIALDVWEQEPAIDVDLLDRVAIGTPHIAGYSLDGKLAGTRMLLEACCQALGLPRPDPADAHGDGPRITLRNPAAEGAELIRDAMLAVYDVRDDDRRLRGALAGVADEPNGVGTAFDQLRKAYPVRRELSAVRVAGWAVLSEAQRRMLLALGLAGAIPASNASNA